MAGIEEIFVFVGYANLFLSLRDRLASEGGDVLFAAQWDGHHPGMALHSPFVTLFDGEGKRVVSGVASCLSGEDGAEGFGGGGVEYIATRACLKENGVEVGGFQLVEDVYQFFFLPADGGRVGSSCARPVQAIDGCEPRSPDFVFGLCHCRQARE